MDQRPSLDITPVVGIDAYQNTNIAKAYSQDNKIISSEVIRHMLDNKLEKGIITPDLHEKAIEQLDELVKGGEGSKGGKIIGHTKSGKPVYKKFITFLSKIHYFLNLFLSGFYLGGISYGCSIL